MEKELARSPAFVPRVPIDRVQNGCGSSICSSWLWFRRDPAIRLRGLVERHVGGSPVKAGKVETFEMEDISRWLKEVQEEEAETTFWEDSHGRASDRKQGMKNANGISGPTADADVRKGNIRLRTGEGLVEFALGEIDSLERLDEDTTVKLCQEIQDAKLYEDALRGLRQSLGRDPLDDEIAAYTCKPTAVLHRALDGAIAAKARLTAANLKLIFFFSRKYLGNGLSQLELMQEGSLGLLAGAEKFDSSRGSQFSTYVSHWIHKAMRRALSSTSRPIRMPESLYYEVLRLRKTIKSFEVEHGRPPSQSELEDKLNIRGEKLKQLIDLAVNSNAVSLDLNVDSDGETQLGDVLKSDRESPDERTSRELFQEDMEKALSAVLHEDEKQVLKLKYGLSGKEHTIRAIAESLGMSSPRVHQIEKSALAKLRRHQYLLCDYYSD